MDPSPKPRQAQRDLLPAEAGGTALRVQVIDGDPSFAAQLTGALEAHGISARFAVSGRAGLEAVAAERPSLVVVCAELPDVSGYAICGKLRHDPRTAGIPVVVTSTQPRSFRSHSTLRVRADAYLRKPFEPDALAALLEEAPWFVHKLPASRAVRFAPAPEADDAGAGVPDSDEVLEDGFEYVGGGPEEELDEGHVGIAAPAEPPKPEPFSLALPFPPAIRNPAPSAIPTPAAAPTPVASAIATPTPIPIAAPTVAANPIPTPIPIPIPIPTPATAASAEDVLEDGFDYVGGGDAPQAAEASEPTETPEPTEPTETLELTDAPELDDAQVCIAGLDQAVAGASRLGPGRWRMGNAA